MFNFKLFNYEKAKTQRKPDCKCDQRV